MATEKKEVVAARVGMLEELKRKYPEKVEYLESVGFQWVKHESWFGFEGPGPHGEPIVVSRNDVEDTSLEALKERVRTGLPVWQ